MPVGEGGDSHVEALATVLTGVIEGAWQTEPISGGKSGGRVLRVLPEVGDPVVVKLLRVEDVPQHLREECPGIGESEYRFYTELMPRLGIPGPRVFKAGRLDDGTSFLVMEDLALGHHIPPEGHVWDQGDLQALMRTYGLLHGRSLRLLRQIGLPDWLNADPRRTYDPGQVIACIRALAANPWTAELAAPVAEAPGLEALVTRVAHALSREPAVLLYNDFYPPNVAFPEDGSPAKLFDWQLVGTGPMQLDMINVGMLRKDEAFSQVDREALLNLYLDTLAGETGERFETSAFREACRYAALLGWGVFMPRMVKALERCNAEGRRFSPWMAGVFQECMADWADAGSH